MNPFNNNYFIGYINHVSPTYSKVHFPSSTLLNKYIFSGEEFNGGLIGSFITIEGENMGFIGKISELDLPEKERLSLSEKAFQSSDFHPTAKVEILLSFDYYNSKKAQRNLNAYPNIGSKVYVCPSEFIQQYVMKFGIKNDEETALISLGKLTSNQNTEVKVSQQSLFGRHCAVVGTTGGGKSWTVSKLIEGMIKNKTKTILIDPTGEYKDLSESKYGQSVVFGESVYYSYKDLTIEDLFFLVKPAEKTQAPKLLEAIRSLKCVDLGINQYEKFKDKNIVDKRGNLIKTNMNKRDFERYCYINREKLDNDTLDFNIDNLYNQISKECIWPTNRNPENFGDVNDSELSNCVSLITRVSNLLKTDIFRSMFGFGEVNSDAKNLKDIISQFISSTQKDNFLLRIGFESVGFEFQAREIAANAIGKYLLNESRKGTFRNYPIVVVIDEAHQFLNKTVVDQYFESNCLSSYDQIAKECRKYGLFLCIATQMPKDIPIGTLSQMGTFIVHRLINSNDKESIKQACSSASSDILAFLPVLGEGEAILTGVDFPMPISVKIDKPDIPPNSLTPIFKNVTQYKKINGTITN